MARAKTRRGKAGRGWLWSAILFGLVLAALLFMVNRSRPQDLPWTALDLAQPIGLFTGRKIAALEGDAARCRRLLDRAGARHDALAPYGGDGQCRVTDAVKLGGGARSITLTPDSPAMACPVAAAMAVWEWEVVQPAARRILGERVESIQHLGTYNCRRMGGSGSWSEHATAQAIDIAGFKLGDGTRIGVLQDWKRGGKEAEFLRAVRDGACDLFSTVLSPDYNAAHADHLHFDQAARGATGWRACR